MSKNTREGPGSAGMRENHPIAVKIGDIIERLGLPGSRYSKIITDDNGQPELRYLEPGCRGIVVRIDKPIQSTGRIFNQGEEDEMMDQGTDGCALIDWSTWQKSLIWREDEGRLWRKV
jgi:hypothetical protein